MAQGGGNVMFVPPEYTTLGGLSEGIRAFGEARKEKKLRKEHEEDRLRDKGLQQFQIAMQLGNPEAAAHAAFVSGLTSIEVTPTKSEAQMTAELMAKGMKDYTSLDPVERQLFNVRHLGSIDPELTRRAMQQGVDLGDINIDLADQARTRNNLLALVQQRDFDLSDKFYQALDETIFSDPKYEKFKGTRQYGYEFVKDQRDYLLRSGLTAEQIATLRMNRERDQAEIDKIGATMDPATAAVVVDNAKGLMAIVRSTDPNTAISAVDAVKFSVNPDDPTIRPIALAALRTAQQQQGRSAAAVAQKIVTDAVGSAEYKALQAILELSKLGEMGQEAATRMLEREDENDVAYGDQLIQSLMVKTFGPEVATTTTTPGRLWGVNTVTTWDLSKAKNPAEILLGTIAAETEREAPSAAETPATIEPSTIEEAIDIGISEGMTPTELGMQLVAIKSENPELVKAGIAYLISKHGLSPGYAEMAKLAPEVTVGEPAPLRKPPTPAPIRE